MNERIQMKSTLMALLIGLQKKKKNSFHTFVFHWAGGHWELLYIATITQELTKRLCNSNQREEGWQLNKL